MNLYPDQLRVILAYIEALDAVDADIIKSKNGDMAPWLETITVKIDDTEIGKLVDEIGGAWSFKPRLSA